MTTIDGGTTAARSGHDLVSATLARHGDGLLAVARRHSLCPDDAADAYQRALELFLRHAARLEPERAHRWLYTVVKHEAMAVRAERQRVLGPREHDFEEEARHEPSPDDRALHQEAHAQATEALGALKPAEAQALVLLAQGRSYAQIAGDLGWTRTKVNRCLAEGRARLRARLAGIESGEECERWAPVFAGLADGSADATQLTAARRHLRACGACRASVRGLHEPSPALGVLPVGLAALLAGLQERALGFVVRGQVAVDALTTGKGVAVAASAAALAGGGVAAVDRALDPPGRATAAQVRSLPGVVAAVPDQTRAPDPRRRAGTASSTTRAGAAPTPHVVRVAAVARAAPAAAAPRGAERRPRRAGADARRRGPDDPQRPAARGGAAGEFAPGGVVMGDGASSPMTTEVRADGAAPASPAPPDGGGELP